MKKILAMLLAVLMVASLFAGCGSSQPAATEAAPAGTEAAPAGNEAAGSADPTAIRDQLEATESFDGLLGHMSVDPTNHNPSRDAAIFRVDADQVSYVGIYDPAK